MISIYRLDRKLADVEMVGGKLHVVSYDGDSVNRLIEKLRPATYEKATSLLPNLDHLWTTWKAMLIALGLGYELGALPTINPGEDLVA
jgi:hypothetical protein